MLNLHCNSGRYVEAVDVLTKTVLLAVWPRTACDSQSRLDDIEYTGLPIVRSSLCCAQPIEIQFCLYVLQQCLCFTS